MLNFVDFPKILLESLAQGAHKAKVLTQHIFVVGGGWYNTHNSIIFKSICGEGDRVGGTISQIWGYTTKNFWGESEDNSKSLGR